MSDRSTGQPRLVDLEQAAGMLGVTPQVVSALASAGYLAPDGDGRFPLVDLRSFVARNADNGSGNLFVPDLTGPGPQALLDALGEQTPAMAARALEVFTAAFPETRSWSRDERLSFTAQAEARFDAILAVARVGVDVADGLVDDLQAVGADAAWSDAPLPQLLVVLRISRDLLVQTAIAVTEERGRNWNLALSLVLTRVLPAIDRLTDALAQGWWAAVVSREDEHAARYEHVVEHSVNGIYEVDMDGRISYANESLARMLGRSVADLVGARISDVVVPRDGAWSVAELLKEHPGGSFRLDGEVIRADGVRRVLDIRAMARRRDDRLVGFQGVVQDVTTARDLEQDKNEFLALITSEVRQPVRTILGLGATLETHAGELPVDRLRRMGSSVRLQAERIARLADDLHDVSRLETQALLLSPRTVDLRTVVEGALATVVEPAGVDVRVPAGVDVVVDPRRLEQVLANLIENALEYGRAPVVVEHRAARGAVEVSVTDRGDGVPDVAAVHLFSRLRLVSHRERGRGTGLGLALVKGLVEAMGGQVWYERAPEGGACFKLTVPTARPASM